ncbi:hypothetical protein Gpo141_00010898 [Globisporangium polare]
MATNAAEKRSASAHDTRVVAAREKEPVAPASLLTVASSSPSTRTARAVGKKAIVIDDLVPPSDTSCSPPSPSPSPPSPLPTQPVEAAAAVTASAANDRPRLKVVIPPVPPFLHEVDKRNERERARLVRVRGDKTVAAQQLDGDDDSDFRTPEKQQPQHQQTFKRKSRSSGDLDDAETGLLLHESEYRMSQITPPPSERMLDHKNPPLPPRKMKKRRRIERPVNPITGRLTFTALPLPRLSLGSETSTSSGFSMPSPPMLDTPPGSPVRMSSVFRSLADEFAAVQDTPPLRTLRPPPRITRAARQCTPPISSRTRSAIQTPTTTMVLRSRQLNPSSKT